MKKISLLPLLVIVFLLPALSGAATLGLSRISLVDGDVLIRTEDGADWLPASINTPLKEGDSIWCPEGSRAELQMRDGTMLRLDQRSALDILALDERLMQFHLGMGRLYLKTGNLEDRALQIDLPDSTLLVNDKSRFRVDLSDRGDEEIAIFKGTVYVESGDGKTRVRAGEMLTNEGGGTEIAPLDPPDEWERWNTGRDRRLAEKKVSSRYLPEELGTYAADLDVNGEWVFVRDYGYVWRPTVIYASDWSPYRVGRWAWVGDDYVWISSESWGWAPYHYGRWVNVPTRGWCWVPPARDEVYWAPGYVGWVSTSSYVGWVPLAPGEVYYGRGYYGRNSVNITSINVQTRVVNNVYRNVGVRNSVVTVRRDSFNSGRPVYVNPRENLFARGRTTAVRPEMPQRREGFMPVVKQIPPSRLPPPVLRQTPIRQVRERHPLLTESRGLNSVAPQRVPANRGTPVRGGGMGTRNGAPDGAKPVEQPLPRRGERPVPAVSQPVQEKERLRERQDRPAAELPRPQAQPEREQVRPQVTRGRDAQPAVSGTEPKPAKREKGERKPTPGAKRVWKIMPKEPPAKPPVKPAEKVPEKVQEKDK